MVMFVRAKDAKALNWNMLHNIPREQLLRAIAGKDMEYVDVNWDVPLLFNDKALEKIARDCVAKLLQKFQLSICRKRS